MGCVCCSLSSFISILLDAIERISLCTVCALLTCCIMFTIVTVMVIGIGIGYHYCYVQQAVDAMTKGALAVNSPTRKGSNNVLRSVNKAVNRGFGHRLGRREADNPPSSNNNDFFNDSALPNQNYTISYSKYNLSDILPALNSSIAGFV